MPVLACDRCGKDLSGFACECIERRTKIDIIFEKTVEHVDVEVKQCPACNSTVKAKFPDDMPRPLQYGNGIKAYVIQLLVEQMINLNRVVDMVAALIGRAISEATLLSYVMRLYFALESWENKAKLDLMTA